MRERREDGEESTNETLIEEIDESNQISLQHSVLTLPTELVSRIFSQLDCVDLIHCSLVCKSLRLVLDAYLEWRMAFYLGDTGDLNISKKKCDTGENSILEL
ncbi:hypothetical protein Sjap_023815 [Stephania japonica]|uniref:F-box domain-containing protein n=1 Tax=Stephania japonica TaxID=461633 RepID=A0AAP0EJL6_9MAGN